MGAAVDRLILKLAGPAGEARDDHGRWTAAASSWKPHDDPAWKKRSTPARTTESFDGPPGPGGGIPVVTKGRGSSVGVVYSAHVRDPKSGLSYGSHSLPKGSRWSHTHDAARRLADRWTPEDPFMKVTKAPSRP